MIAMTPDHNVDFSAIYKELMLEVDEAFRRLADDESVTEMDPAEHVAVAHAHLLMAQLKATAAAELSPQEEDEPGVFKKV